MGFLKFLLLFSAGLAIIIYRERLQRFSGSFAFAEKWFGQGGTFQFYLLLGLGFIVFSVLYITGTLDAVIEKTIGRFLLAPGQ